MNINELSDAELNIYRLVSSLNGTIEEKTEQLKNSGSFDKYIDIHKQYLIILKTSTDEKEINESLKRLVFLNWYHLVEPNYFTGIFELDRNTIHESYSILNDFIKLNKIDNELNWMISYYCSIGEWTILLYSENEMPELTDFVKNIDIAVNHLPSKEFLEREMPNRGQMGEYFKG